MIVGNQEMFWCQVVYFQGEVTVYLSPDKEKTKSYNKILGSDDIVVAVKSRGKELQVIREDLMAQCPFKQLQDGFSFTHPTMGKVCDNEHATQLKPFAKGEIV